MRSNNCIRRGPPTYGKRRIWYQSFCRRQSPTSVGGETLKSRGCLIQYQFSMALIVTYAHFYATPTQRIKACQLAARISRESPHPRKPAVALTSCGDRSISRTEKDDARRVGSEMLKRTCKAERESNFLARKRKLDDRKVKACPPAAVLKLKAKPAFAEKGLNRNGTSCGDAAISRERLFKNDRNVTLIYCCASMEERVGYCFNRGDPRPQLGASESKSIAAHYMLESMEVTGDFRLVTDIFNSRTSVAIKLLRAITIVYICLTIPLPLSSYFQPS